MAEGNAGLAMGALTLTLDQVAVFAILAAALALFAWGRWRYDLVAIAALLAGVLLGVVPADKAFTGFSHPAVITVAAVLIISAALANSGIVETASRLLRPLLINTTLHVLGLTAMVAFFSAFMNNVGALALFLPVALKTAYDRKIPPSLVLMPLSFGSLLGGLMTLVGTPPNIIIAAFRARSLGEGFHFFDFAPVGVAVTVAGVLYIAFIGWRLLPVRRTEREAEPGLFHIEDYITEVRIPEDSPFASKRIVDLEALGEGNIAIVALVRKKERLLAPSGFFVMQAGDILVIEADAESLEILSKDAKLEMVGAADMSSEALRSERVGLLEAVVVPDSRIEGRTARSMRLHSRFGINLLGVARQGSPITTRLGQVRFAAGDVLLLQGERESMSETLATLGCLPLARRELDISRRRPSYAAPLIFVLSVIALVSGIAPPQIAFTLGALAMVLAGEITVREVYEAVDWPVIILLGALIPIGTALESTGGTQIVAHPILSLKDDAPIWVLLALLIMGTMLLTDVLNNAATAILMAPIGVAVADGLGASPDPFLMAVAVGASSAFLTPIGHQSNLLVMGPGGYRFADYWRMGLLLDVIIVAVAVPTILLVWPA